MQWVRKNPICMERVIEKWLPAIAITARPPMRAVRLYLAALAHAQFGTPTALRANNEPLPIADGTGNIGNTANSVTLTPGRYLISYRF